VPTPVEAADRGSGPAVVLLHGQPGDRHDWDDVVVSLAGRARTLVPDRPGYGATGGRAGGFAANAAAVIELLDRSGLPRAVVAGHSWGGGVALDLAERHPERVGALVLVASVGGRGSIGRVDRVLGVALLGDLLSLGGLVALGVPPLRRRVAARSAPDDPGHRLRPSWRSFMVEQRALLNELPAISDRVDAIRTPAVVVMGEADRIVRPSSQHALAGRLSRTEVVQVARAGHLLLRERPDIVAAAILRATELAGPGGGAMIGP
jgi:pimeloyl-ACP methyl ester carboxylesterase